MDTRYFKPTRLLIAAALCLSACSQDYPISPDGPLPGQPEGSITALPGTKPAGKNQASPSTRTVTTPPANAGEIPVVRWEEGDRVTATHTFYATREDCDLRQNSLSTQPQTLVCTEVNAFTGEAVWEAIPSAVGLAKGAKVVSTDFSFTPVRSYFANEGADEVLSGGTATTDIAFHTDRLQVLPAGGWVRGNALVQVRDARAGIAYQLCLYAADGGNGELLSVTYTQTAFADNEVLDFYLPAGSVFRVEVSCPGNVPTSPVSRSLSPGGYLCVTHSAVWPGNGR